MAKSHIQAVLTLGYAMFSCGTATAQTDPVATPFVQRLAQVRSDLDVTPDSIAGPGVKILAEAIERARYVMIGEDHLSREIPNFTAILCKMMAAKGVDALAVETGPEAAKVVNANLRKPDHDIQIATFMTAYPDAMAFMNGRDEQNMAARCAASAGAQFQIWGLDQEFLGAATYLIEQMATTKSGPVATAAIGRLAALDRTASSAATTSGDPGKFFMLSASDTDIDAARAAINRDGSPRTRELFETLGESRAIYRSGAAGTGDSNGRRARLMKRTLRDYLRTIPPQGRVLFKFGDVHAYKGVNPLFQRDLGNFVAERAEGEGASSLHILVLGAKGVHALYSGAGKQVRFEPFVMTNDPDYSWLADALAAEKPGKTARDWSLFDLRPLRAGAQKGIEGPWLKLIQGYDLIVLIPDLTPSELLGAR